MISNNITTSSYLIDYLNSTDSLYSNNKYKIV